MRKNQCVILQGIRNSIYGMTHVPEQAELIAAFVSHIGETIHEEFILVKEEFIENLTPEQLEIYWED